ncbi:hypothetical protein FRB99_002945, partial [Tulasnella sp. 403]
MASAAMTLAPSLTSSLRVSRQLRTPFFSLLPSFSLPTLSAIPAIQSLWDLFPPFLLAVPKKKVSHSRKNMRSANKGLKDKTHIVNCPACGGPKLAHHLCPACYSSMSRAWKAANKEPVEVGLED